MIFAINNLPDANAATDGTLMITQEGTVKLLKPSASSTQEHVISVTISADYTLDSSGGLKIDDNSLSGTITIDDGQLIELDIQKIGTYKDLKTLFYSAKFVGESGNISGKIKFVSPLSFESDSTTTVSSGTITAKIGSVKYSSKTTSGELSIQPASQMACDESLWDHVYHPARLEIVDPCKTVSGIIEAKISEKDGDYHIRLKLDSQYSDLVNSVNIAKQHGDLVVEPICQHKVTQTDAVSACVGFDKHLDIPPVGTHVRITGSYVLDNQHGGWAEIHPVTSIERLDN